MLENHNLDVHSARGMGIMLLGGSSLLSWVGYKNTCFSEYTADRNKMMMLTYYKLLIVKL
jgi:hypothetical protein